MLQTKQFSLEADLEAKRAELAQIQGGPAPRAAAPRAAAAPARGSARRAREPARRALQAGHARHGDRRARGRTASPTCSSRPRMKRASAQDARIISRVRDEDQSIATAERLDRLERAEEVAKVIEAEVARSPPSRASSSSGATAGRRRARASRGCWRHARRPARARGARRRARARAGRVTARLAGSSAVAGPIRRRRAPAVSVWPPTARSRRRSARAGAGCTRASTSDAGGRRCAPRRAAGWRSPAGSAAAAAARPAQRLAVHLLRAPVEARRVGRPVGEPGAR